MRTLPGSLTSSVFQIMKRSDSLLLLSVLGLRRWCARMGKLLKLQKKRIMEKKVDQQQHTTYDSFLQKSVNGFQTAFLSSMGLMSA
jgi:hypothetical protein